MPNMNTLFHFFLLSNMVFSLYYLTKCTGVHATGKNWWPSVEFHWPTNMHSYFLLRKYEAPEHSTLYQGWPDGGEKRFVNRRRRRRRGVRKPCLGNNNNENFVSRSLLDQAQILKRNQKQLSLNVFLDQAYIFFAAKQARKIVVETFSWGGWKPYMC